MTATFSKYSPDGYCSDFSTAGYFVHTRELTLEKQIDMKHFLSLFTLSLSVFLFSCHSSTNEEQTFDALSDTTSITGLTGDSVKLVKIAGINFKVKDVEQSTRAISGVAHKFGGIIYDQSFESLEGGRNELKISTDSLMVITTYTPHADITARIPSENLEQFMYSVADLGYFTGSTKLHIDDRSLEYLEGALKQKNRTEELSEPINRRTKSFTDRERVEVKDEVIEQQISNRAIDADVKYSTVKLSLFQNPLVRREIIANYFISDYHLPFSKRLSNAISDGWQYFLAFVLALAHLWMFIMLAVAIFLCYRYLQHKRKFTDLNAKS